MQPCTSLRKRWPHIAQCKAGAWRRHEIKSRLLHTIGTAPHLAREMWSNRIEDPTSLVRRIVPYFQLIEHPTLPSRSREADFLLSMHSRAYRKLDWHIGSLFEDEHERLLYQLPTY